MIGVIEHQKIGELFLVQLARHVVHREQAARHRGKGEKVLAGVIMQRPLTEKIAGTSTFAADFVKRGPRDSARCRVEF